jgi:hypothetical protein
MMKVVVGLVLLALVGGAGVIVFKLVTDKPGAAACDNLAKLPDGDQAIAKLERYVESRVVEMRLTKTERAQVSGSSPAERCESAIETLDKAMTHGQFMRLVDCIAEAKTARSAARCI